MDKTIILNTALDFINHLEYAAIRRVVIELQLKDQPDVWKKVFIKRISARDNEFSVLTIGGETISGADILALIPPFDDYDSDAISCMCG
ncbi:MAG: hypothetical protein R3D00_13525 [Bacteroidia bacterium]